MVYLYMTQISTRPTLKTQLTQRNYEAFKTEQNNSHLSASLRRLLAPCFF